MVRRLLPIAALTASLIATVIGTGFASPTAAAPSAADSSKVKIELDCAASPETSKITNRSDDDIKIESVGSLFDRTNKEPYNVNETLKKGKSITLESGPDARGGDVLTKQELYDDTANKEGAKVNTSIGTFKERC
jgi:hypothetical protein